MKEEIKEYIQSFFSFGTLTIVGSGLSCAEGMPGMGELAGKLLSEIPKHIKSDNDCWNTIKKDLEESKGLEEVLLNNPPDNTIEELIIKITNDYLLSKENEILNRMVMTDVCLRFGKYIARMPITKTGLPIVTTNYDRLIEFACEKNRIYIDSGFLGRFYANLDPTGSRFSFCKNVKRIKNAYIANYQNRIKLFKPHGCFSWHLINGEPISTNIQINSPSLIITPGFNKYRAGYEKPFDLHREGANKEIDNAARYIIIGYGFNDDHLETHLKAQIASGKPTLIITKFLTQKAKEVINEYENVTAIESDKDDENSCIYYKKDKIEICGKRIWDLTIFIKEVFNER